MASFNASEYLDEAVCSVLDQSLNDIELIIIDDCSADKTLEMANRKRMHDDRVAIISLPINSGPAAARNAGLRAARGEWVGILDSDDVAMRTRFAEQMSVAASDKRFVMIGSDSLYIDARGHVIKEHKYPTSHHRLVNRLYTMRASPPHSSMVYKRDVIEKLSGFNPKYSQSEDYDLWLRLSEVGRVASIGKPLVKIRKHLHNTSNKEAGMQQVRLGFSALVCHFLRIHGCPDPSVSNEETTWQEFITWVDRRMTEEGSFEMHKAREDARSAYFTPTDRMTGVLRLGSRLLQSGHAGALVLERLLGSSLPKRLAQEWMKRSINVS